jgi:coenzyme Q-binding protein COQ10
MPSLFAGFGKATTGTSSFHTKTLMHFSPKQVYDVVAQVQHYKRFVPHCTASDVVSASDTHIEADLTVQYMMVTERYRSKVDLVPNTKVVATSHNTTLFELLNSTWTLAPGSTPNTCWVDFQIDYKFKSSLYETLARKYFDSVAKGTIAAFEKRCKLLYSRR